VISGRARADVLARLESIPVRAVVGNHGLEPSADAQRYRTTVRGWLPLLREKLESRPGVEIENKLYSLSIHYRRAKLKSATLGAIRGAISALNGEARSIPGKQVINLLPTGAPDKGATLSALRDSVQAARTIYIGDDATDEDAFRHASERLLGIKVGRSNQTHADYYLAKQTDVDRFLENLLELSDVA
jgi:trehalose 6-phosphate phosphatase